MSEAPPPTPRIAVVGTGALGGALARRLVQRGLVPWRLVGRSPRADALGRETGVPVVRDVADTADADVVALAVPDGVLPALAARLAAEAGPWAMPPDTRPRLVLHTAGSFGADVLAALADAGADTLAFHPAQTFADGTPPDAFDGAAVALDGTTVALERGRALAAILGLRPVVVPPAHRATYHLALSIASNFTVALAAVAAEVLGHTGLAPGDAHALVRPLMAGTVANLARSSPEEALSGPVVRGDAATVGRHLDALAAAMPHLTPVYAALATEAVRVAVRANRLAAPDADALLDRLAAALTAS